MLLKLSKLSCDTTKQAASAFKGLVGLSDDVGRLLGREVNREKMIVEPSLPAESLARWAERSLGSSKPGANASWKRVRDIARDEMGDGTDAMKKLKKVGPEGTSNARPPAPTPDPDELTRDFTKTVPSQTVDLSEVPTSPASPAARSKTRPLPAPGQDPQNGPWKRVNPVAVGAGVGLATGAGASQMPSKEASVASLLGKLTLGGPKRRAAAGTAGLAGAFAVPAAASGTDAQNMSSPDKIQSPTEDFLAGEAQRRM